MVIERIFLRPPAGQHQVELTEVEVSAGAGLVGDRYFGCHEEPGQNVTWVEAEVVESFLAAHGRAPDLSVTKRNIVTRGVRLNDLVGREFSVGGVRFRGVELCEPCLGLGQTLASADLAPAAVVKALVHRAGLRADALTGGWLRVGSRFEIGA